MSGECKYCDDKDYSNPFHMYYAERVRAVLWLQPWRYYHKVPHHATGSNLVGSYPVTWYERKSCTKQLTK
jgi:hypothetical protein